ncbi:MAG: PKD domain-containing protein [Gammaproteobacteria bacterium]|nr:PKD domain-containing protein [Gammaproteobacteria bacterium]
MDGSASHDSDGAISAYRWRFSAGAKDGNESKISRRFTLPGIYFASLTVLDDSGTENAQAHDRLRILVNHAPQADAGAAIRSCDARVHFDGRGSSDADGNPLAYQWDFGDGSPKVHGAMAEHTYQQGGNYTATLNVDDGTGLANSRNSAATAVFINRPPLADIGQDRTVCAMDAVIFDAGASSDPKGGALNYRWDFGDGNQGTGLKPVKLYRKGGVYPVTLTVEDDTGLEACNSHRDRMLLRVAESPAAEAGPDQTVCVHAAVRFDGRGSRDQDGLVNTFSWNFGDGGTGTGSGPIHMYGERGTYAVTMNITGDRIARCDNFDSDTLKVSVQAPPAADFHGPKKAPVGVEVVFDASPADGNEQKITGWQWDFGDGGQGEGKRVAHKYQNAGRYQTALTVTTDGLDGCNVTVCWFGRKPPFRRRIVSARGYLPRVR